jgi:ubiquinone/menaquinone biosynthesis C-methylase UbiE
VGIVYDNLASVYDQWIKGDSYEKSTLDFYVKFAEKQKGPVVELGVGTGRIAVKLAQEGINVIGVDISEKMLKECQIKLDEMNLNKHVKLIKADIVNFHQDKQVDMIYLPFRTLGHILSHDDLIRLFNNVNKNLVKGGKFVFDHYILDRKWAEINAYKKK